MSKRKVGLTRSEKVKQSGSGRLTARKSKYAAKVSRRRRLALKYGLRPNATYPEIKAFEFAASLNIE